MAKKDKESGLTGGDILIAVLIALAVSIGFFLVVLVAGSLLFPESWERPTADQPVASQPVRGTLPSSSPANTPTTKPIASSVEPFNEPEPKQTVEPAQKGATPATPSQAPVQSSAPAATSSMAPAATPSSAPVQNPGAAVSIQPTTQQPGGQTSYSGNNSSSYSRANWPQGKFLGSIESDKYHSRNCRAAATILPENEIWFDSETAAQAANYSRCGICW